jgi:hypothetical protein
MLAALTDTQVFRIYNRLLARVPRDLHGADWHTLYTANRGLYHSLQTLVVEVRARTGR